MPTSVKGYYSTNEFLRVLDALNQITYQAGDALINMVDQIHIVVLISTMKAWTSV